MNKGNTAGELVAVIMELSSAERAELLRLAKAKGLCNDAPATKEDSKG